MNGLSQYVLTVVSAALVAAVIRSLAGQGAMGSLVKLMAGVFVALTICAPLLKVELPDIEKWFAAYGLDGQAAAEAGEEMAADAASTIISEQMEAYIMDKAAQYRASVTADVELDETGVPVSVTLQGDVSPYAKARLTQLIESDLGLREEAQQWIS